MENDGYRLHVERSTMLPRCYATESQELEQVWEQEVGHTHNEDQGKLVGSQQGTENTQVLEHNSNWWGSGGRRIITPYLRRLKYDDYISTHKHDFKLCKKLYYK